MSDFKNNVKIERPTEKKFGIFLSILSILANLYLIYFENIFNPFLIMITLIIIFITFIKPILLKLPNILWLKFGLIIGSIVSSIIMILIYFIIVCPIGLYFKLIKKDLINSKINKNIKSYWVKRVEEQQSMKKQY